MTAEEEKRLILLGAIMRRNGKGSKREILDEVERAGFMKFSEHDLQLRKTRNELNWRNDLAYIKDHLTNEGHLSAGQWNTWAITERGKEHFASLASLLGSQRQFQHFNSEAAPAITELISREQISDENALSGDTSFAEGKQVQRWTTTYERNAQLRAAAIKLHGVVCKGCGFNFEAKYGVIGSGFIEVHHTKPISTIGGVMPVNPDTDLIVLCSNCHSIVHRKRPTPLTLEALKALLKGKA